MWGFQKNLFSYDFFLNPLKTAGIKPSWAFSDSEPSIKSTLSRGDMQKLIVQTGWEICQKDVLFSARAYFFKFEKLLKLNLIWNFSASRSVRHIIFFAKWSAAIPFTNNIKQIWKIFWQGWGFKFFWGDPKKTPFFDFAEIISAMKFFIFNKFRRNVVQNSILCK